MRKFTKSALLITTALYFAISGDAYSSSHAPAVSASADTPIMVDMQPRTPQIEIGQIVAALEVRQSGHHGAIAREALQKYHSSQFMVAKIPVQQARAAAAHYNSALAAAQMNREHKEEVQRVRGGADPEALRRLADQFLQGAVSFTDLLFLYPFMIGAAANEALVEEGLRKTRLEIERVELLDRAFKEDRAILPLGTFLRLPEVIAGAENAPNVANLKRAVEECHRVFSDFKGRILGDNGATLKFKNKYLDFKSVGELKPKSSPARFMSRLLDDLVKNLNGRDGHPDILGLTALLKNNVQNISQAFKTLLLLDVSAAEQGTLAPISIKSIPDIQREFPGLLAALEALSLEINSEHRGGNFRSNMANLEAQQGNILLRELTGKFPRDFHNRLIQNIAYFKREENAGLGFDEETVALFKENARKKNNFLVNREFNKIFANIPSYKDVSMLRLDNGRVGRRDIQSSWYAQEEKIERIIGQIISSINGEIRDTPHNIEDHGAAALILQDSWDGDIRQYFYNDQKPKLLPIVQNTITKKINANLKIPILDIMEALYNAQYAHAYLISKMRHLREVIGHTLNHVNGQEPVESRAIALRELCQNFEGPMAYYALNSEERALAYVLVLGSFTSAKAWVKLGVQDMETINRIIEALTQAREAYLNVRAAIQALAIAVPGANHAPREAAEGPRLWSGFEMDAPLLVKFDPADSEDKGDAAAQPGGLGVPPPAPLPPAPPPPPGAGGASPLMQLDHKIKAKLTPAQYKAACEAFLVHIIAHWKHLDYVPTLDDWADKAREVYNAAGGRHFGNLQDFKAFLDH
jgi:hypothetical protein